MLVRFCTDLGVLGRITSANSVLLPLRTWPHQHLDGRTPAEVWDGKQRSSKDEPVYISAWEGLLTGFFVPQ